MTLKYILFTYIWFCGDQNMQVLGISGSPTENANTDKLVKAILDATGLETEFIKLSEVNIQPCTACMSCVYTNECVLEDDFREIGKKVLKADALVVGSPTYYASPSAYTKAFMERLYAFRHIKLLTRGKIAAVVAVGLAAESAVAEWLGNVLYFGGMEVVGKLTAKGTPCCFVCGPGETCAVASWNAYSPEIAGQDFGVKEAYKDYLEILPDNVPYVKGSAKILKQFRNVEDEPEVMAEARSLGEKIRAKLEEKK
jgi:multimeric flavodoxin WrbA